MSAHILWLPLFILPSPQPTVPFLLTWTPCASVTLLAKGKGPEILYPQQTGISTSDLKMTPSMLSREFIFDGQIR